MGSGRRHKKPHQVDQPSRRKLEIVQNINGEKLVLRVVEDGRADDWRSPVKNNKAISKAKAKGKPFTIPIPAVMTDGVYDWTLEDERNALRHGLLKKRKAFIRQQRQLTQNSIKNGTFQGLRAYITTDDRLAQLEEEQKDVKASGSTTEPRRK
eukprot:1273987-Amorphochlora_amoeboformis.AAC.1